MGLEVRRNIGDTFGCQCSVRSAQFRWLGEKEERPLRSEKTRKRVVEVEGRCNNVKTERVEKKTPEPVGRPRGEDRY